MSTVHNQPSQVTAPLQVSRSALSEVVRACVTDGLPVDATVARRVKSNFRQQRYGTDADRLLKDILDDPGLFFFCLTRLTATSEDKLPPVERLRRAGILGIREIILSAHDSYSRHQWSQCTVHQAKLRLSLNAATVIGDAIADTLTVEPMSLRVSTILEHTPLLLLAWNLPRLFERAVTSSEQHLELGERVRRTLGFTLQELSAELYSKLHLEPVSATGETHPGTERARQIARTVSVAQHPEIFPSAHAASISASREISQLPGRWNWSEMSSRILNEHESLLLRFPRAIADSVRSDLQYSFLSPRYHDALHRNPLISRCPPQVRHALCELYEQIANGASERTLIEALCAVIIPRAGFTRGCVYTFEASCNELVPRLAIGNHDLSLTRPLDCSAFSDETHIAVRALRGSGPIAHRMTWGDSVTLSVAQLYGRVQCAGVIHLDTGHAIQLENEQVALLTFGALRVALIDVLSLK